MADFVSGGFTASAPRFTPQKLSKVLIANRGEIACRIIRTARALNLGTVAVYTAEDAGAPHVLAADEAVELPGKESEGQGYLHQQAIIDACKKHGAQAVIPGYGFLSESAAFAKLVASETGLVWAGPSAEAIEAFGLKHRARELATAAGVPCVPGTGLLNDAHEAQKQAEKIGYPIMLKSTAGGGGLGLLVCRSPEELAKNFETVSSRGRALFGDAAVFMEKYVAKGRHVEVQIFGNGQGDVVHFGERECSIQRRHQKVIEECPSPFVQKMPGLRERLTSCAVRLAESLKYKSAGTCEFLVDDSTSDFYFLEVNTRLQVEHGITELCYNVDLVALMMQQADCELVSSGSRGIDREALIALQKSAPQGAAIEARLYAENAVRDFAPSPGLLQCVSWASTDKIRLDSWIETGTRVTPSYDPLLAKIMAHGSTRDEAVTELHAMLSKSLVQGPPSNLDFLAALTLSQAFREGRTTTDFLSSGIFTYAPTAMEVVSPGSYTSVQDYPARRGVGYGAPEAGPMDALSFRLANIIVGNPEGTAGLELTLSGPELLFHCPAVVALAGAEMEMTLDGKSVRPYTRIVVPKGGSRLKIGKIKEGALGCRAYLAIRGGLPGVPVYLGSKATSPSLGIGGYQGRQLLTGDTLELDETSAKEATAVKEWSLPEDAWPSRNFTTSWNIYCMHGPYDSDDFLTAADRKRLFESRWTVSHNSSRTGYRLDGPKLEWARNDGGEGGSHPSNLVDYGYSLGGINWNGDTPVILTADGPNLGGLLISHTVIRSEWRLGQVKPSDTIRFVPISFDQARSIELEVESYLSKVQELVSSSRSASVRLVQMDLADIKSHEDAPGAIVTQVAAIEGVRPLVTLRAAGDRFLLVEYGSMTADILNRCRIELLARELTKLKRDGVLNLNPNARALTVQFDGAKISQKELIDTLVSIEERLPPATEVKIPNREWTMPITFDDPLIKLAVERYIESIRDKAVYLPDTMDYLARANGYSSAREVQDAALGSAQLVVAVGFYFGTPILLPLDPRRRIMCQKYNPTRLYTPEGTVGLGGTMYAIYGCDSPGGYPMVGRTLPTWDTFGKKNGFSPQAPWLLQNFDTIRFKQVSQAEYDLQLRAFKAGTYTWEVRDTSFDVAQQSEFLTSVQEEVEAFRKKQAVTLEQCRVEEEKLFAEWREEQDKALESKATSGGDWENHPTAVKVTAGVASNVWKVLVEPGDKVEAGQKVAILEAMKMEIDVIAPQEMDGCTIKAVVRPPGTSVSAADVLLVGAKD